MFESITVAEIDQLLDELEQLAHSSTSRQLFVGAVLERFAYVVQAAGTAILLRSGSQHWMAVASRGSVPTLQIEGIQQLPSQDRDWVHSADMCLLAVSVRRIAGGANRWQRGALCVAFEQPLNAAEVEGLLPLCHAFAEILAMRQWSDLENFLDHRWLSFQKSLPSVAGSSSLEEAAYTIVNELVMLVEADRVSLARRTGASKASVLAISGVIKPEQKAAGVVAIERLCGQAIDQDKTLTEYVHERPSAGTSGTTRAAGFENYVCIPFASQSPGGANPSDTALLFEWQNYESFLQGCAILNYVLPAVTVSWRQQQRWLNIPRMVRVLSVAPTAQFRRRRWAGALRWLAWACVLALGLWALNLPTTLRIATEGTLQPIEKRAVFAALDGVVERVLVEDGQRVEQGQLLVEMRSPPLEIQIEEVLGQIDTNAKKRDGLSVLVNQLSSSLEVDVARQSRLSSEIQELETELQTLEKKLEAFSRQRTELMIKSPIDGIVVARQLDRYLDARPVRRGDALLRVVKLNGPWQLELQVADQDSGYVRQKLFASSRADQDEIAESPGRAGDIPLKSDRTLRFVFVSQPDIERTAQATWLSNVARNPLGEGMVVDLVAQVAPAEAAASYMGAGVYAYVDCGKHPFWFVWSRPFIEAIQRRMWF